MAHNANDTSWLPACDLCGSFSFDTVELPYRGKARRCRECGLLALPAARNGYTPPERKPSSLLRDMFVEAVRRTSARGAVLLVGTESLPLAAIASKAGRSVHAIVPRGAYSGRDIVSQESSLEGAAYVADHFDVVVCAASLETLETPSLLFTKSRTWLKPGGLLVVTGVNYGSLASRLWKRNWLRRYAGPATHLFTLDHMKEYAARSGFDIETITSRSTPGVVAGVAAGTSRPPILLGLLVSPLSLASNILNIGDEVYATLEKQGPAVVPIQKIISERDEAPGLAPAMYTGMHREAV